jgi:hypothetical protein
MKGVGEDAVDARHAAAAAAGKPVADKPAVAHKAAAPKKGLEDVVKKLSEDAE